MYCFYADLSRCLFCDQQQFHAVLWSIFFAHVPNMALELRLVCKPFLSPKPTFMWLLDVSIYFPVFFTSNEKRHVLIHYDFIAYRFFTCLLSKNKYDNTRRLNVMNRQTHLPRRNIHRNLLGSLAPLFTLLDSWRRPCNR